LMILPVVLLNFRENYLPTTPFSKKKIMLEPTLLSRPQLYLCITAFWLSDMRDAGGGI
ncbi:hypothetical protein ACJX0J_008435, partial [Zea mays]